MRSAARPHSALMPKTSSSQGCSPYRAADAARLEHAARSCRSVRLDARKPNRFAPFLGLIRYQLAERGGRARNRDGAELSEPRLDTPIREGGIDLLVEPVDDRFWRVLRCNDAAKTARLVACHKLADCR